MFRLESIEMKTILRLEERMKKRDALNVIPVVMRDQDVSVDAAIAMKLRQAVAKHPEPGAAIENEMGAIRSRDFDAGSVAAVAPGVALRGRRRAAHAPENQFL